ncbi:hypothetical protein I3843_11G058200 [Carya illinoinensis]|uniref:Cysteine-rich transmembrane domain-containing protein n=1 Tax=Carya illinoinensis TaxID=32201 RepID=A0A8T1P1D4_CARIL|nr:cysteine-rich and transmembrane domain-containing protein WIH2-like [Carya illinoinensis]KAG2679598.1 hypothetical protein I3760_11G057600 [Carya illinoinensis]KAG6635681.1 hypothetical protein CIPAW_11G059900 [Carya illinoinensis]KAG6687193.1 hypothetical protein I3842_11G058300 [Carya illinoinensis]KAG7955193.1 hypothetical protein I3843_11G058200 [Carya illinoinensis]
MSHHDKQQVPGAYPPPVTAYPPNYGYPQAVVDQGKVQVPNYYVAPPPPIGYPTRGTDPAAGYPQHMPPVETTTRGEGFWKGCVAALCCCWVLDFCCC